MDTTTYIVLFFALMTLAVIGVTGIAARISQQAEAMDIGEEEPKNLFAWIPFLFVNALLFLTHILAWLFSSIHPIDPFPKRDEPYTELPPESVQADNLHFTKDDLLQKKDKGRREQ